MIGTELKLDPLLQVLRLASEKNDEIAKSGLIFEVCGELRVLSPIDPVGYQIAKHSTQKS